MSAGGSRNDDVAYGAFKLGETIMKNRIRVLRAEKGWSQAELAERVHVSRNSVNAVENGKFDPSLPLAFRIADAFALKIEDVFLRDDPR
jgi:putative transcriptional regulator